MIRIQGTFADMHLLSSHGLRIRLVGSTAVCVALLLVVAPWTHSPPSHHELGHRVSPRSAGGSTSVTPNRPLTNGTEVTLAEAQSGVDYQFGVPDTPAASSGNLTSVWLDSQSDNAAMVFNNGDVAVMLSRWSYPEDPASWFATIMQQNDATTSLQTVDGNVALVITPNTDYYQSNPAWVEFDLGGVNVNIISLTEDTATLLGVADSLVQGGQTSCSSCAASGYAQTASASLLTRQLAAHRTGMVEGTVRFVRPVPPVGQYRMFPGVVRAFKLSGVVIASEYVHGANRSFSLRLSPGRYLLGAGASENSRRRSKCRAKEIRIRAHHTVRVMLNGGCSYGP